MTDWRRGLRDDMTDGSLLWLAAYSLSSELQRVSGATVGTTMSDRVTAGDGAGRAPSLVSPKPSVRGTRTLAWGAATQCQSPIATRNGTPLTSAGLSPGNVHRHDRVEVKAATLSAWEATR